MSGFEAWAVRALAAGGLVLLAGYLLAKVCRGPARRQAAVAWAVRGAVLAAVVAAFPGWLPVTLPATPVQTPSPVATPEPEPLVWEWVDPTLIVDEPTEAPAAEPLAVEPAPVPVTPVWPAERWLAVGYALVATAFGLRLLVGHLALARLTRRASPAPPRVRLRFPGRVFVADRVQSPVCFGVLRPTVLLPRGLAETASAGELDWVLAHEADHLRRGDHRSTWWAAVAGCVFFPLPWFWAVRRELVLAQEFLADAAAAGDRPADYAAYLVHLSASPTRLPQLAAGVRAGRSDLSRRVTMLLNEGTTPRRASRGWRLLVGGGAVAGAVALGGLTVREAAADEPKPLTVEVEVRLDDEKPAADKKPDGDKKPEVKKSSGTITLTAKASPEVAKLKEQIKAAAKKGNADEVAELVEKLEKVLRAAPKTITLDGEIKGPGRNPARRGEGGKPMEFGFETGAIDEAIKQLQAQLDGMKTDEPQAKAAVEAALAALKAQSADGARLWRKVPVPQDPFAQKPRFGAVVEPVPESVREQLDVAEAVGIQVAEVKEGTPAATAGVKKGDVLVQFAGKDVNSDPNKFVEQVRGAKPGKAEVVVVRKGKKQTLNVDLPEAAKPAAAEGLLGQYRDEVKRSQEQAKRAEDQAKRAEEAVKRTAKDKDRAGAERNVKITIENEKFQIQAERGGPKLKLKGTLTDGKPTVTEVQVDDNGEKFEGKAIADVPEKYRAELKKLLGQIGGK